MELIDKVKLYLNIQIDDSSKDNLLLLLIQQSQDEFCAYCNRDDVPALADNVIIDMCIIKYNLMGQEGYASTSFSGASETIANYPPQLIKALNRWRKVKLL